MLGVCTTLVKDSRHAWSLYYLSEGFKACLESFTTLAKDSRHAWSLYYLSEGFKACLESLLP